MYGTTLFQLGTLISEMVLTNKTIIVHFRYLFKDASIDKTSKYFILANL